MTKLPLCMLELSHSHKQQIIDCKDEFTSFVDFYMTKFSLQRLHKREKDSDTSPKSIIWSINRMDYTSHTLYNRFDDNC